MSKTARFEMRLSPSKRAAIDEARGAVHATTWVEGAVDLRLAGGRGLRLPVEVIERVDGVRGEVDLSDWVTRAVTMRLAAPAGDAGPPRAAPVVTTPAAGAPEPHLPVAPVPVPVPEPVSAPVARAPESRPQSPVASEPAPDPVAEEAPPAFPRRPVPRASGGRRQR